MTIKIKILAFLAILNLTASAAVRADDSTIPTAAAPAGASAAASPAPKKHHHKHKTPVAPPVVSNNTVPSPAASAPQVGASAGSSEMPDTTQGRGAGDIGGPNRGSGDHTPGTTGTSGQ